MNGTQERTKAKNTGVSWFIVYTAAALPGLIRLLEHYLATDRMPLHYMALGGLAAAAIALPLGNLTRNKTTTFKVITAAVLFLSMASINWLITS